MKRVYLYYLTLKKSYFLLVYDFCRNSHCTNQKAMKINAVITNDTVISVTPSVVHCFEGHNVEGVLVFKR